MERLNKKQVITGGILFLLVLSTIWAVVQKSKISADGEKFVSSKKLGLQLNGKTRHFVLSQYLAEGENTDPVYLFSMKNNFNTAQLKLENLGQDAELCATPVIAQKGGSQIICLEGTNGAHTKVLALIKYTSSSLSTSIASANGQEISIFSDLPDYNFEDVNKDGFVDIIALTRDYDKDPLKDTIKNIYLNTESGFVLRNEE